MSNPFDAEEQARQDALRDAEAEFANEEAEENEEFSETDEFSRMAPSEAEAAAEAIQAAATQIETLTDEVASLKDRLLREMAEMENLRRRSAKEKADATKFAVTGFARDMISVGDNLDRALQALPDDVRAGAADEIKNLFTGVEMTNQEMLNIFERHGIKQLKPLDEKFNPNFHQAMFEVPNTEIPNGTIVEVVQVGYAIGERVLRPALVGVSKGGPKVAAQPAATDADNVVDFNNEDNLGGKIDTSA